MELLKKENLLIAVAVICIVIYCNRQSIKKNQLIQENLQWLRITGGLAFGLNTLMQVIN